jgi:general secretion pathway protein D
VNTQFQYIDVGVEIEMTPTVHFDHDITLKLKITDSSESGTETISGVTEPILANKSSEQTIRLREGEASILAGIVNKQDLVSLSGIPGLAELPLLKYVFGSKSHEVIDDEIVFVLIPHVVRGADISPLNLRRIDTGAGQTVELRHVYGNEAKPAQTPANGAPGSVSPRPNGTQNRPASGMPALKGQTAEVAASSALAQMRQESGSDVPSLGAASAAQSPTLKRAPGSAPDAAGPLSFVLTPPASAPTAGSNFKMTVALNGAKDVASVPLQIQYDAGKLTLINVDSGDLLGKDGQAVALVHRDDGPGMITIAASRPPGTAGVSGSGSVCVLTFEAKQAGESDVTITHPGALDSTQKPIPASAQNAHVVVKQ